MKLNRRPPKIVKIDELNTKSKFKLIAYLEKHKVVFHRHGRQYFIADVQLGNTNNNNTRLYRLLSRECPDDLFRQLHSFKYSQRNDYHSKQESQLKSILTDAEFKTVFPWLKSKILNNSKIKILSINKIHRDINEILSLRFKQNLSSDLVFINGDLNVLNSTHLPTESVSFYFEQSFGKDLYFGHLLSFLSSMFIHRENDPLIQIFLSFLSPRKIMNSEVLISIYNSTLLFVFYSYVRHVCKWYYTKSIRNGRENKYWSFTKLTYRDVEEMSNLVWSSQRKISTIFIKQFKYIEDLSIDDFINELIIFFANRTIEKYGYENLKYDNNSVTHRSSPRHLSEDKEIDDFIENNSINSQNYMKNESVNYDENTRRTTALSDVYHNNSFQNVVYSNERKDDYSYNESIINADNNTNYQEDILNVHNNISYQEGRTDKYNNTDTRRIEQYSQDLPTENLTFNGSSHHDNNTFTQEEPHRQLSYRDIFKTDGSSHDNPSINPSAVSSISNHKITQDEDIKIDDIVRSNHTDPPSEDVIRSYLHDAVYECIIFLIEQEVPIPDNMSDEECQNNIIHQYSAGIDEICTHVALITDNILEHVIRFHEDPPDVTDEETEIINDKLHQVFVSYKMVLDNFGNEDHVYSLCDEILNLEDIAGEARRLVVDLIG